MISTRDPFTFQEKHPTTHFSEVEWKRNPIKVFLVEDSRVIRLRLKRMCAEVQQIKVIGEAQYGQSAIDAIRAEKPDVVIMSIHLELGNGLDVLHKMKKAMPATKLLALTHIQYPEYRQQCLEAGANFFFDLSTQFDQMVPVLKQLIQQADNWVVRSPGE
jgi:DNA-binding NarL/FixJ family response regulator